MNLFSGRLGVDLASPLFIFFSLILCVFFVDTVNGVSKLEKVGHICSESMDSKI